MIETFTIAPNNSNNFTQGEQVAGVMFSEVYISACLLLVLSLHIPDICDKGDVSLCVLCKASRSPAPLTCV